jgi:Rab GDP dissociation inhibitor
VQVRKTSKIVRAIAILDHPLPGTHDADSCQIILPQRQVRV